MALRIARVAFVMKKHLNTHLLGKNGGGTWKKACLIGYHETCGVENKHVCIVISYQFQAWRPEPRTTSSYSLVTEAGLLRERPALLIPRCVHLGSCSAPCLVHGSVGVVYPVRRQEEQQWSPGFSFRRQAKGAPDYPAPDLETLGSCLPPRRCNRPTPVPDR
ncbi:uncharacterized protein [Vulpes vulpes]|uniref:Uncharacterized protein isoform X5 n=1 Tax=Vulpes vulpes TaxID=9627 RepID=A0ABM5B665_VULVU